MPRLAHRAYDRAALLAGVIAMLSALRLDNGLTVVHAARPGPVAAIEVWIGAGAADEPIDRGGVAHAVEHMLFRSSRRGARTPLAAELDALGGEVNAWTGFDHTVVHAAVPAPAVPAALVALAGAIVHPRLAPDELDAERGVIAAEHRDLAGDPARAAAAAVFRQLFLVHPYRRPVVGTPGSIAALRAHDLERFFHAWYVAANAIVVIAGGPAPAALAPALAGFAALPARPVVRPPRGEPAQTALRAAVEPGASRGPGEVAVAVRTAGAADPDRAALDVIAAIVGRAPGLAAAHHVLRDAGAVVVTATAPGRLADTAGAIAAAIARIGGLDDRALADAVAGLDADDVRGDETAPGLARRIGLAAAELDLAREPTAAIAGAIAARRLVPGERRRALAASAVRAVARDRLRPDRIAVAGLGSRRASARPLADAIRRKLGAALRASRPRPTIAGGERTGRSRASGVIRAELANGLVVLIKPDPGAPIVAMRALWPGGSRLEDGATAGATALLARVIGRGCGADAGDGVRAVAELGGQLAGTAGRNGFGLRAEWPARHWERGLAVVADCVLDPQLAADEVAAARRSQLAELARLDDDPARTAFRLFTRALYQDHPYRLDPLGTADSVGALTRDDLVALHRERYPVSRLVLAIVGDVDPDAVLAAVRRRFAAPARPRRLAPRIAAPAVDGRPARDREVYLYRRGTRAQLVIGFPGAVVTGDDRHAVAVLAAILDGPAGRLFAAVRDRRGLAYTIGVHAVDGVEPGYLAIHVACAPEAADAVVAAIRAELDRLADAGPTADEVDRARRRLIAAHARAGERRADVAHGLAFAEASGAGWQAWDRYPAELAALPAHAVALAARRTLRWDRAVIATVRPPAPTPGAARRSRARRR